MRDLIGESSTVDRAIDSCNRTFFSFLFFFFFFFFGKQRRKLQLQEEVTNTTRDLCQRHVMKGIIGPFHYSSGAAKILYWDC
jgi:hypothetical protein